MKKVLWIMVVMLLTLPVLNGCGVRGDLTLPEKEVSQKETSAK